MTEPSPTPGLDRAVHDALVAEADGAVADDALLERIRTELAAAPPARARRIGPWLVAAGVAVAVGLAALSGVVREPAVVDRPTDGIGGDDDHLLLPASLPSGMRLARAERAPAGADVARPFAYHRAHFVGRGPDPHVVFADWVAAPSTLAPSAPHDGTEPEPVERIELDGGSAVIDPNEPASDDHGFVKWTGDDRSGWLISDTMAHAELLTWAQRFLDEGGVVAPAGFERVAVYADRPAMRLVYERAVDPDVDRDVPPPAVELHTYRVPLDLAARRRLAAARGADVEVVDVGGRPGLRTDDEVLWAPAAGLTARVTGTGFPSDELLAVARATEPATGERWHAVVAAASGDGGPSSLEPRAFTWRVVARGIAGGAEAWVVARREPLDEPGCYHLHVLERGEDGACDGAVRAVAGVVAARVPAEAAEADIVVGERTYAAAVHPLDDRWSVAVADGGGGDAPSSLDSVETSVVPRDGDGRPLPEHGR